MKKNLILGTLVLCLFGFFSCKPKNSVKITSATISPETVTMRAGETFRLTLNTEPSSLQGVEITWSSSNEEVATVNNLGVVTAVGEGSTNIYASVTYDGETVEAAPCAVKVATFFEALKFTQACPFFFSIKDSSVTKKITAADGTVYECYICDGSFIAFSEGLYLDDEGYFVGSSEGAYLEFDAKLYYGTEELNNGDAAYFCLGSWLVTDQTVTLTNGDTKIDRIGVPGKYDAITYAANLKDAMNFYNQYVDATADADKSAAAEKYTQSLDLAAEAITGATLEVLYYECDENGECGYYTLSGYNGLPYGLINAAQLELDNGTGTSSYMLPLTYSYVRYKYFDGDFFGLDAAYDETTHKFSANSDKILESAEMISENGTLPANEAQQRYVQVKMMPEKMAKGFMENKARMKARKHELTIKK